MAKREKKPPLLPFPSDPGAALFLELMMQMLAFFILLTSYATIVDEKRMAAIGSLTGTFSTLGRGANMAKGDGPGMPARSIIDGSTAPKRTAKELTNVSKALGLQGAMTVLPLDKQTVRIRFPAHIAFQAGHVDLSKQALKLIDKLAIIFKKPEVIEVRIEGHSDNKPIHSSIYPSNWELSAARAMSVFNALAERGVAPSRMIAGGMGGNHPVTGHPELDRRVDITLKFRPVTSKELDDGPVINQYHKKMIDPIIL
jgi:chemotaxis protein MotB